MACPICSEIRVTTIRNGHEVYACGFSSDGTTVLTPCLGGSAKCTCATHDLMTGGCRCGAFEKEKAGTGSTSASAPAGTSSPTTDPDAANSAT